MNLGLSRRIATVKISSLPRRLRKSFDFTSSVPVPDLLTWFEVIGYNVLLEADISSKFKTDHFAGETCSKLIIRHRLCNALKQINPNIPDSAIAATIALITFPKNSHVLENNICFHKLLTEGVDVEYRVNDQVISNKIWLIDTNNLLFNDWLVVHPFTITEGKNSYHLDVVIFINGLPLAVIVWLNPEAQKATLMAAYHRLQTYKQKVPDLFSYNAFLVIASGKRSRVGTLTSEWKDFLTWHSIDGEDFSFPGETELDILIQGIFDKRRFLDLVKHFILFEQTGNGINKKLLCHPFCTTQKANRF